MAPQLFSWAASAGMEGGNNGRALPRVQSSRRWLSPDADAVSRDISPTDSDRDMESWRKGGRSGM